jgi:hypothetical protein
MAELLTRMGEPISQIRRADRNQPGSLECQVFEYHVFECHGFGVCDRTADQPPIVRWRRRQTEAAKPPLRRPFQPASPAGILGQLRLIIARFRSLAGRPAPPLIGDPRRDPLRGRANVAIIGLGLL